MRDLMCFDVNRFCTEFYHDKVLITHLRNVIKKNTDFIKFTRAPLFRFLGKMIFFCINKGGYNRLQPTIYY